MSGITQLVAIGAQDVHLTGKPDVSFFRNNFKRYTNFSLTTRRQLISGNPTQGGMSTVRIEKNGDLLNYMFIVAVDGSGQAIDVDSWGDYVEQVELLIGGQVVDTQDSVFTEEIAVDTLANNFSKCFPAGNHAGDASKSRFYPLRFFCCESWGSSIPLVALQYHDVEIRIKWGQDFAADGSPAVRFEFNACFVCLDADERNMFTSSEIDLTIFQVQKSPASNQLIHELNFNHPVKYIASSNVAGDPNNLVASTTRVKLEANGVDITDENLVMPYFTTIQSYYHTDYSYANTQNAFLYSFGLLMNRLQPTGTLNFSRLNSFKIHSTALVNKPVYAVNYNILRIKNGMGAVVYAN